MKPRPVSMMVPRTGTFGPTDLPPKAAEAPEPRRAESRLDVPTRPGLSRTKTPDFSLPPDDTSRSVFTRGTYADVPKVKARLLNLGQALYTDGHTRLIEALRDECARLHGYNQHLKNKVHDTLTREHLAEVELQTQRMDAQGLRDKLARQNAELASMAAQLDQATEALSEVDTMFLDIRKRRLSRLGNEAKVVLGDVVPSRPRSPTAEAMAEGPYPS